MMNTISPRLGMWLLVGILTLSFGCTKSNPDRPKTYPVSGTVTYKGGPVADANLSFQLSGGKGFAVAKTDAAGKYALMTYEAGDGTVPGEYKVGITQYEKSTATGPGVDDPNYGSPEEGQVAPAKNLLPAKYANPETSELTASVTEGPNTVNFELTD